MSHRSYREFWGYNSKPQVVLPNALVEREKHCDHCGKLSTIWQVEDVNGSDYTLCDECIVELADKITAAKYQDYAGCEATERDQEGSDAVD
jgi:hypothetical protein